MLPELVGALACPRCHQPLVQSAGTLRCAQGHSYDIARQGYVTLRPGAGPRHDGDDAAMVAARVELLGSGAYDRLATRVAEIAADAYPGTGVVVDAGGGTGAYLARVLDRLAGLEGQAAAAGSAGPALERVEGTDGRPRHQRDHQPRPVGLVLDSSPYALRRAARAHPSIGAVGCDLWQRWPVRDATAGLVLGVFAPRNGPETRRVLRADGTLVLVTPAPGHLAELVPALALLDVDERKAERVARALEPYLRRESDGLYEERLRLSRHQVATLAAMGPSARHVDPAALSARVGVLAEPVSVTVSMRIGRWTRRIGGTAGP